jgi:hypothetical protein
MDECVPRTKNLDTLQALTGCIAHTQTGSWIPEPEEKNRQTAFNTSHRGALTSYAILTASAMQLAPVPGCTGLLQ